MGATPRAERAVQLGVAPDAARFVGSALPRLVQSGYESRVLILRDGPRRLNAWSVGRTERCGITSNELKEFVYAYPTFASAIQSAVP